MLRTEDSEEKITSSNVHVFTCFVFVNVSFGINFSRLKSSARNNLCDSASKWRKKKRFNKIIHKMLNISSGEEFYCRTVSIFYSHIKASEIHTEPLYPLRVFQSTHQSNREPIKNIRCICTTNTRYISWNMKGLCRPLLAKLSGKSVWRVKHNENIYFFLSMFCLYSFYVLKVHVFFGARFRSSSKFVFRHRYGYRF